MQNRIEEHHDYEATIWDYLIELLTKIKVLMMHTMEGENTLLCRFPKEL